jgi:hypothetical protein
MTLWIVDAMYGEPCLGCVPPTVALTLSDGTSRPSAYR